MCFFGTEELEKKNWERAMEKVCTRNGNGCYLSFPTGAGSTVSNLIALALWRRLTVLPPPGQSDPGDTDDNCGFFWSEQHWLRSAALYLPVQKG